MEGVQDLADTRERIIKSTMDLAKRQRTWFKRNSSIQWVADRSYVDGHINNVPEQNQLTNEPKPATMKV